jgi:hypothetical protein
VLDQARSRDDGHWRVVVRFTTEPGSTYVLAMPADQCRAVDDPQPGLASPRLDQRPPSELIPVARNLPMGSWSP